MKTYKIPADNLGRLKERIEHLQRKAEKLNAPPIKLTVGKKELVPEYPLSKTKILVYNVVIEGEAPKLNGWQFIATLEHNPAGNIIRNLPFGAVQVPEKYRHISQTCDHCGYNRDRKDTYLVWSQSEGFKQVGKTCLKDFTGANNPHKIAAYLEQLAEFFDNFEDDFIDQENSPLGSRYFSLEHYLAYVVMYVEKFGYESRSKSLYDIGTCDHALTAFWDKDKDKRRPNEGQLQKAKDAINWIRELNTNQLGSEYMWNLYITCSEDYIGNKHIGLAASLIPTFSRYDNEPAKASSNFVGEIGKRIDLTLKVEKIIPTPGAYGTTYITKLVDNQGNQFTWFASNILEEGVTYTGKGTVKKHEEYRGIQQTIITRCKFTEVE